MQPFKHLNWNFTSRNVRTGMYWHVRPGQTFLDAVERQVWKVPLSKAAQER